MTALRKYQRLESPGIWRFGEAEQRREVVVALRENSLVISDPKSDMALSHWSLPAVTRLNPGAQPALFSPGADATEILEVEDSDMVAALETVLQVLYQRQPRPGRLRGVVLAASSAVLVALALFWLPGAATRHTASVLPEATRARIGLMVLKDVTRLSGSPCAAKLGREAAELLAARLFSGGKGDVVVLRDGFSGARLLPGNIAILSRDLVEAPPDAETAAGAVVAAQVAAEVLDPVLPLLVHAGVLATFRLLTTGALPDAAVTGYAEILLGAPLPPVPEADLLAAFQRLDLSASAYAQWLQAPGLRDGDPFKAGSPRPVLADDEWISLQGICAD